MPFGSQNSTDGLGIQAPAHEENLRTARAPLGRFVLWCVINCHTRRLASKASSRVGRPQKRGGHNCKAKFERQAVLRFLSWGEK